jgi:hypothetical protein
LSTKAAEGHSPANHPPRRNPPRFDPVKAAAKMVAKNPTLVARIKPDGEIEIASKSSAMPASKTEDETPATLKRLI